MGSYSDKGTDLFPEEKSPTEQRVRSFQIWGWWLATLGTLLFPLLALGSLTLGILVLCYGEAKKTGQGIGIILASIVIGTWSFLFWCGFFSALGTALMHIK